VFRAEIPDEDNSAAQMYRVIGELPQPNRDTLAFLAVHFQRCVPPPPAGFWFTPPN